ncbi:MAG: spore cortex biosynthesis protein YabQ [Clostridia bacterium]|nr:spore cortex biosynthesis protein YabQ [Clostridia bacterium]
MWEISITQQIISFLYAVAVGVVWAVCADVFRAENKVFRFSAGVVFLIDVANYLIFAFITFMLLMARCNGEIRGFILVGEALGFFIYRITLSRFIVRFFVKIISFFKVVNGNLNKAFQRFGAFLELKQGKVLKKIEKIVKKGKVQRKNS